MFGLVLLLPKSAFKRHKLNSHTVANISNISSFFFFSALITEGA